MHKLAGQCDKVVRRIAGPSAYLLVRNARAYVAPGIALAPDIVHAHDLYTLFAGWRIARKCRARLVYDSHELERGRSGVKGLTDRAVRMLAERFLIKRAAAVITVSDSIADQLVTWYRIPRPILIHNSPRSSSSVPPGRPTIRDQIGLSPETKLAVYIGAVTFNRGLDIILESMASMPDVHVAFVGARTHAPTEKLVRSLAAAMRVEDRFHLIDPVPADEVTHFVSTADVSLALVQDACLSYRYSFPNKLLESLFARVPVVASRLPEFERMVALTGAGITVDETDPCAIAGGVQAILADRSKYEPSEAMMSRLHADYGWEQQGARLLQLYRSVAGKAPDCEDAGPAVQAEQSPI